MLWTDSLFVSVADLETVDPDFSATAAAQLISLTGNGNVIQRGIEDAGRYLEAALISFATYISSNDLSANHLAAVFYTGSQPNQRRRATLEQIVTTGRNATYWGELKQWAINRVLMAFYLQAANRAEGDRYTVKLKQWRDRDIYETWPMLKASGIPVVYRPMPTPAAVQGRNPGMWFASAVALMSGTVDGSVDVSITYVDSSKYVSQSNTGNAESNPSAVQTVALTPGNGLHVDITSLNPPTGAVSPDMISRGFTVPGSADGWNLYVGLAGQTQFLQNASPIPIAQKTYDLPGDPRLTGSVVGLGQWPDAFLTIYNLTIRG